MKQDKFENITFCVTTDKPWINIYRRKSVVNYGINTLAVA